MIFLEQDLPQKSEKWHKFRLNGIGASEVPAILGKLPPHWNNPYEVFLQKLGKPRKEPTKSMERGVILEDKARNFVSNFLKNCKKNKNMSIFCENCLDLTNLELEFNPEFQQLTAQYKYFDKIFASFDGIDEKNGILLEIKCPEWKNFSKMVKKPDISKIYYDQVQTQLMIANSHWGINKAIFANFYPEGIFLEEKDTKIVKLIRLILIEVDFDKEYCDNIIKTCENFWKMIENKQWNKNWNNE